jgi:hypothetical protein
MFPHQDPMQQMQQELKDILFKIQAHEELGNLDERERMIYSAVNIAKYLGYDAGFRPIGDENGNVKNDLMFFIPEWAGSTVAYIVLPTGQVAYFLKKHTIHWDGHDRQTKLKRIADFIYGTGENHESQK